MSDVVDGSVLNLLVCITYMYVRSCLPVAYVIGELERNVSTYICAYDI